MRSSLIRNALEGMDEALHPLEFRLVGGVPAKLTPPAK